MEGEIRRHWPLMGVAPQQIVLAHALRLRPYSLLVNRNWFAVRKSAA